MKVFVLISYGRKFTMGSRVYLSKVLVRIKFNIYTNMFICECNWYIQIIAYQVKNPTCKQETCSVDWGTPRKSPFISRIGVEVSTYMLISSPTETNSKIAHSHSSLCEYNTIWNLFADVKFKINLFYLIRSSVVAWYVWTCPHDDKRSWFTEHAPLLVNRKRQAMNIP